MLRMCSGANEAELSMGCVREAGGMELCLPAWQDSQRVGQGSSGVTVSDFYHAPLS